MRIVMIFGLVFGLMIFKAYLIDMIQQYYSNKDEEENERRYIFQK